MFFVDPFGKEFHFIQKQNRFMKCMLNDQWKEYSPIVYLVNDIDAMLDRAAAIQFAKRSACGSECSAINLAEIPLVGI